MTIERFTIEKLWTSATGSWVKYIDHRAAVDELEGRIDALKAQLEVQDQAKADGPNPSTINCGDVSGQPSWCVLPYGHHGGHAYSVQVSREFLRCGRCLTLVPPITYCPHCGLEHE